MDDGIARLRHARAETMAHQGMGLADLSLSIVDATDATDAIDVITVNLRFDPTRPDLTIAARSIHYFAVHRVPGDDIPFFDFEATVPIPDEPWPHGLPGSISTTPSPSPLLWIHADRPVTFDLVAAVVTVLTESRLSSAP